MSVKLAIARKVDSAQLFPHMPTFVCLFNQSKLSYETAAMLLVYSVAHHMTQVAVGCGIFVIWHLSDSSDRQLCVCLICQIVSQDISLKLEIMLY